ncbi:MAG: hypothetical protein PV344_04750, partial [Anaplasma sp.]|nr:hypothetical protein [Anaplasma sp.]
RKRHRIWLMRNQDIRRLIHVLIQKESAKNAMGRAGLNTVNDLIFAGSSFRESDQSLKFINY